MITYEPLKPITEQEIAELFKDVSWEPQPSPAFEAQVEAAGAMAYRLSRFRQLCAESSESAAIPLITFLRERASTARLSWEALSRKYGLSGIEACLTRSMAQDLGRLTADLQMPLETVLHQFRLQFTQQYGLDGTLASARSRRERPEDRSAELRDLLHGKEIEVPPDQMIKRSAEEGERCHLVEVIERALD